MGAHLTMDVRSDANLSPSCIFPNCQKKRTKVKAILKISEWNSKAWGGGECIIEKRDTNFPTRQIQTRQAV